MPIPPPVAASLYQCSLLPPESASLRGTFYILIIVIRVSSLQYCWCYGLNIYKCHTFTSHFAQWYYLLLPSSYFPPQFLSFPVNVSYSGIKNLFTFNTLHSFVLLLSIKIFTLAFCYSELLLRSCWGLEQ